jgi:hypothetical protein
LIEIKFRDDLVEMTGRVAHFEGVGRGDQSAPRVVSAGS